jgi:FlaA1/EpsC-like NDP-sugar epimerase
MLRAMGARALELPRSFKRMLVLALDAGLCVLAVWLAYYLRLGALVTIQGQVLEVAVGSIALALPIFVLTGMYRAIFRYTGLPVMLALAKAMVLYALSFGAIFTVFGVEGVPRTIGLIQPMVLLILVTTSRMGARVWLGGLYHDRLRKAGLPRALVYGAGNAGRQLASAMANSPEIRVVGFLDDDDRLHGQLLNGQPIYSPIELESVLRRSQATDVLLAIPSAPRSRRNEILNRLKAHKVVVRTLPGLSDIATGKVSLSDVRELDIDDLLGREPVQPHRLLLQLNITGRTVMVTGAGGSIGSELCRQILKSRPKTLLLVEISEFALYQIQQELQGALRKAMAEDEGDLEATAQEFNGQTSIVPLLASVCDERRMDSIMRAWRPSTVYHAAAYKHVPLVEHNPAEGVRNNVWGTLVCAEVAKRNSVKNFVLVSTDKAVRPTNIMGATKRLAEMVLQALAETAPGASRGSADAGQARTCFSMVRFGNVLGSSGSVVPLFREQIRSGGPITLTHPEITRYFMTIPEAAQLVIQSGAMGTGGDVFVLDMGQPVKIIDLARRMVELAGLAVRDESTPSGDIEFSITGLRPGEKLYEELLIGDNPKPTQHARIMKAHEHFVPWDALQHRLTELRAAVDANDVPAIRTQLQQLVSGYQPNADVVDWVHVASQASAAREAAGRGLAGI